MDLGYLTSFPAVSPMFDLFGTIIAASLTLPGRRFQLRKLNRGLFAVCGRVSYAVDAAVVPRGGGASGMIAPHSLIVS